MMLKTGYDYFRGTAAETIKLHEQIREAHAEHPELNTKELSTICFCGENAVERALRRQGI